MCEVLLAPFSRKISGTNTLLKKMLKRTPLRTLAVLPWLKRPLRPARLGDHFLIMRWASVMMLMIVAPVTLMKLANFVCPTGVRIDAMMMINMMTMIIMMMMI